MQRLWFDFFGTIQVPSIVRCLPVDVKKQKTKKKTQSDPFSGPRFICLPLNKKQNKREENQLLKFSLCIPVSEFYLRNVINFIYHVGNGHLFAAHRCTSLHLPLSSPRAVLPPPAPGFCALWLFDLSLTAAISPCDQAHDRSGLVGDGIKPWRRLFWGGGLTAKV